MRTICASRHMLALSEDGISWGRCRVKRGDAWLSSKILLNWFIIGVAIRS